MASGDCPDRFPTTMWNELLVAKNPDDPQQVLAMNRLISGYWRPVFFYLRTKGMPVQQAEDLTQEFFLRFIERRWLAPADPSRGRFRTFLLTVLSRFVADQSPARTTRQNGFEQQLVPISALVGSKERSFEPPDTETAEQVFMRQWARAVIRNVRRRLKGWCEDNGRPDWYRVFAAFNLPDAGDSRVTQEAVSEQLKISRDQVRYALSQTNDKFAELLQGEIAEQVDSPEEVGLEIQELQELLG